MGTSTVKAVFGGPVVAKRCDEKLVFGTGLSPQVHSAWNSLSFSELRLEPLVYGILLPKFSGTMFGSLVLGQLRISNFWKISSIHNSRVASATLQNGIKRYSGSILPGLLLSSPTLEHRSVIPTSRLFFPPRDAP